MSTPSVFDLKTSPSELPSITQGTANLSYQQISSQPEITNTTFGGNAKKFKFDVQGTKWWVPSRSYFRFRLAFYRQNGQVQPIQADNIAPSMALGSCLFQSAEVKFANRTVSKCDDNMGQIDALQTRLSKSKAWLDSIGESNFWQPDFYTRQALITSDYQAEPNIDLAQWVAVDHITLGFTALSTAAFTANDNTFTFGVNPVPDVRNIFQAGDYLKVSDNCATVNKRGVTWRVLTVPTAATITVAAVGSNVSVDNNLGVVGNADVGIGAFYRLRAPAAVVTPGHNVVEICWQPPLSIFNQPYALPVGSYEISMVTYPDATWRKNVIQSVVADKTYGVDYNVVIDSMYLYISTMEGQRVDNMTYYLSLDECNVQPFSVDANTSSQKKQADVSPSTYALTAAFQSQLSGGNTLYPPSLFKFASGGSSDTDLNQLYIQYAGQTRPSPYADPLYNATTDYLTQRWLEDHIYSGAFYDSGGSENKSDYITRGPYYHFSWPKDGNDSSTRVYVNYKFTNAPANDATRPNLLLFSHYKKTVGVTISNGQITDVSEQLA